MPSATEKLQKCSICFFLVMRKSMLYSHTRLRPSVSSAGLYRRWNRHRVAWWMWKIVNYWPDHELWAVSNLHGPPLLQAPKLWSLRARRRRCSRWIGNGAQYLVLVNGEPLRWLQFHAIRMIRGPSPRQEVGWLTSCALSVEVDLPRKDGNLLGIHIMILWCERSHTIFRSFKQPVEFAATTMFDFPLQQTLETNCPLSSLTSSPVMGSMEPNLWEVMGMGKDL